VILITFEGYLKLYKHYSFIVCLYLKNTAYMMSVTIVGMDVICE